MTSQTFGSRLRHAWNAFLNRDPPGRSSEGYSYRPDRVRLNRSNDRTIMTASTPALQWTLRQLPSIM